MIHVIIYLIIPPCQVTNNYYYEDDFNIIGEYDNEVAGLINSNRPPITGTILIGLVIIFFNFRMTILDVLF